MELPAALKKLYRHWDSHIQKSESMHPDSDEKILGQIPWFISERMAIWEKKISGAEEPYTEDPILSRYRFCNIFREFDRQTIAFHTMLSPLRDDFPLWLLNMFYCRTVARPETIERVGLLSFDEKENEMLYERLMDSPRPRFGTPYVFPISTIQHSATPTREQFIAYYLPKAIPAVAKEITTWDKISVCEGVSKILPLFGYNLSFLWTEVLIDTAYQFPDRIDLFKRFPVGPGALPTFKKIAPREDPSVLAERLTTFPIKTGLTINGHPIRLSAENWEGIGCEFRKYTNLKNGKGRKRIYKNSGQK